MTVTVEITTDSETNLEARIIDDLSSCTSFYKVCKKYNLKEPELSDRIKTYFEQLSDAELATYSDKLYMILKIGFINDLYKSIKMESMESMEMPELYIYKRILNVSKKWSNWRKVVSVINDLKLLRDSGNGSAEEILKKYEITGADLDNEIIYAFEKFPFLELRHFADKLYFEKNIDLMRHCMTIVKGNLCIEGYCLAYPKMEKEAAYQKYDLCKRIISASGRWSTLSGTVCAIHDLEKGINIIRILQKYSIPKAETLCDRIEDFFRELEQQEMIYYADKLYMNLSIDIMADCYRIVKENMDFEQYRKFYTRLNRNDLCGRYRICREIIEKSKKWSELNGKLRNSVVAPMAGRRNYFGLRIRPAKISKY